MSEHDFNQCANDWVTCKCGKVFGDDKDGTAKDKFLDHLVDNGIGIDKVLYYECQIRKARSKMPSKRNLK